jgi:hypothetical protein
MIHKNRSYQARLATLAEVANILDTHMLTLCSAFEVHANNKVFYIVNDAFSEDGAQEYAVLWALHNAGQCRYEVVQVESITASWVKGRDRLEELFTEAARCERHYGDHFLITVAQPESHGQCPLCA